MPVETLQDQLEARAHDLALTTKALEKARTHLGYCRQHLADAEAEVARLVALARQDHRALLARADRLLEHGGVAAALPAVPEPAERAINLRQEAPAEA